MPDHLDPTTSAESAAADAAGEAVWRRLAQQMDRLDALVDGAEALVDEIGATVAELRSTQSPPELSDRVDVARALAAATARLARAADVATLSSTQLAVDADVPLHDGVRTERLWLAASSGIGKRDAGAILRASRVEERFGLVARAFADRRIELGHLDAVASIIPSRFRGDDLDLAVQLVQDIEDQLVAAAEQSTVDEFAAFCRQIRTRLDHDGPGDRSATSSTLWITQTFDGRWMLQADLSADDGAILVTLITEQVERIRCRLREEHAGDDTFTMPSARELQAMALRELAMAGAASGRRGRVGLFLHIDLDDLAVDRDPADDLTGGHAHTEADLDISDDTLWAMLADAEVTPVVNHDGQPLSFGRTRRLSPDILRRVLAHRDRRCRWPGCDLPAMRSHLHHIVHWEDGGPTDPENEIPLCAFHHYRHHNHGWGVGLEPNGDGSPGSDPIYRRRCGSAILRRAAARGPAATKRPAA